VAIHLSTRLKQNKINTQKRIWGRKRESGVGGDTEGVRDTNKRETKKEE